MEKKLYKNLVFITLLSVLLTALLFFMLINDYYSGVTDEYLHREAEIFATEYMESGNIDNILLNGINATVYSQDGTVIYKSENLKQAYDFHSLPIDIMELERNGFAHAWEAHFIGDTIHFTTFALPNGDVFVTSRVDNPPISVFIITLPGICIAIIIALIASSIIAKTFTISIIDKFTSLTKNKDDASINKEFPELVPVLVKISGTRNRLEHKIEDLNSEKSALDTITANMKEGLVYIGQNGSIVSLNDSAMDLLNLTDNDYLGCEFTMLGKNDELMHCIRQAREGQSENGIMQLDHRFCHIYASPVIHHGRQHGAIILLLDVTEREKSDSIRREFSANVSHELKTPITSISGYAELIANGMTRTNEDTMMFANRIVKESSRLILLVEDIIHLSHLDESSSLETEECSIEEIVSENITRLENIATSRNVKVAYNGEVPAINANYTMMDELIANLCENAIKYNKEGGEVMISLIKKGAVLNIIVKDTGIGVAQDDIPRIFQRFYRVDKSRSKQTGGTGLGLSIAKHIVELHNGTINMQSKLGEGTTITVAIPYR